MKKYIYTLALITSVAIFQYGCKKDDETTTTSGTSQYERGSNDETARDEYDESIDNIFKALENT